MRSFRVLERARRGAVSRALALGLAMGAAAALLVVLARELAPRRASELAPAAESASTMAPPADDVRELGTTLSPIVVEETALASAARAALAIEDGVRLAGDGALDGVVLDRASSAPVPGIAVELAPIPPASRSFFARLLERAPAGDDHARRLEPVAVVHTDTAGRFRFEGVRRGVWFVGATDAHWILDAPARARTTRTGGAPVEVWVREGGRVLGRVLHASGAPARGARVVLAPGPATFVRAMERGELASHETTAGDDGRFAFPAVAPSEGWELSAIAPGSAVSHVESILVAAGRDTEATVELAAGGAIEGRILSAPREPGGEALPLAGARVAVVPRGLRHLRLAKEILLATSAVSGPDGRYLLHGVPAGTVDVVAMAAEHVPARGPIVRASDGATARADDLVLQRGPVLAGRVRDSAGAPVAGARVRWMPIELDVAGAELAFTPMLAQGLLELDFPTTDADGRFTAGPFPGSPDHLLWIDALGFQEKEVAWNPERDGATIDVVLARGGAVEGVVMDLAAAKPVPSFTIESASRIELEADAPSRHNPFAGGVAFEDERGRFRLDPVAPGEATLVVRAEGYVETRLEDVVVREGETTRGLIVKLTPGARVRGTVLDADGTPVGGALVLSDRAIESARATSERVPSGNGVSRMLLGVARFAAALGFGGDHVRATARDGSFELAGLDAGEHTLHAFHRDWCPGESAKLSLAASEVREGVVIRLARGAALYGRVTDRFGRPVAGVSLIAFAPPRGTAGSERLHQGMSGAEGRYEIAPIEPGGYFVLVTRGDGAFEPASFLSTMNLGMVTVPAEGRVRHDVVDSSAAACRVYGRVTAGGEPVTDASVSAFALESDTLLGVDFKVAQLDDDGGYQFAGLPPGEHRFQIDARGHAVRLWADVPDAPEHRLDLEFPDGRVAGVVLDAETRAPIAGAAVSLAARRPSSASGVFARYVERTGASWHVDTDEVGRFQLERLGEGPYQLWANEASHAASAPIAIDLGAGEQREHVEILLGPPPRIAGVVHDQTGIAIAGARAVARHAERAELEPAQATSDPEGRFVLACLASGPHVLTVTADGFAPRVLDTRAPNADAAAPLDVMLEPGMVVRVLVLGPDGRPASGVVATLAREDAAADEGSPTIDRLLQSFFGGGDARDADGWIDLGRHAPGRYRLDVRRGLGTHVRETVELPAGEREIELRVHLEE